MRLFNAVTACAALLGVVATANSNITTTEQTQQFLKGDFTPTQSFKNINLVRNTNLDKGYVRETINVVIENVDTQPQTEYYVPFEYDLMGKVGGFEARDKKDATKGKLAITKAALDAVLDEELSSKPTQYYIIHLPQSLAPKAQLTLAISYNILSSLTPLPATIKQDDKQYLTYSFSAYVPSAYTTLKQKTKIKFPSTDVPEYTITSGIKSSADPEKQGATFTYGEYDTSKVPTGTKYPVTVRYEFTKPLLACNLLERDVEVSHWGGNLATEERYWLRNDGANLVNHFSRVSWATHKYYNNPTTALEELQVPLKPGSVDPYFTDDIGNVSTSRYRPNQVREAMLLLKPRYPLFGGWKYSFRIGWNNALSSAVRKLKEVDTYALSVPFLEGPKMPEGVQYERVQVRVIFPEGAKNIKWEVTEGVGMPILEASESLHRTFMDTIGRTTLQLTAQNVVDDAREGVLTVTYEYPSLAMFRKPLSIFAAMISVFAAVWAIGRLDTSIGKK